MSCWRTSGTRWWGGLLRSRAGAERTRSGWVGSGLCGVFQCNFSGKRVGRRGGRVGRIKAVGRWFLSGLCVCTPSKGGAGGPVTNNKLPYDRARRDRGCLSPRGSSLRVTQTRTGSTRAGNDALDPRPGSPQHPVLWARSVRDGYGYTPWGRPAFREIRTHNVESIKLYL